jgi:RNA polymerase sigma-70 factor, ECF subfamily
MRSCDLPDKEERMSIALRVDETVPDDRSPATSRGPTVDVSAWLDEALPRIYGYFIPRVGGRVAVAEDLTQETMLAAVRTDRGPESVEAVMPWLYGIARHKLMDHYRRQERDRRVLGQQVPEEDVPDGDYALPDIDLESLPVRDAVIATLDALTPRHRAALDALTPRHRAALVLRYLDGCDVPFVAASLGITVDAAESVLVRARAAFRREWTARNGAFR